MWANAIQSIHGISHRNPSSIANSKKSGTWLSIVKNGAALQHLNLNVEELFSPLIGKGDNTTFWSDRWNGTTPLKLLFPDLFAIETNKNCVVADRMGQSINGRVNWIPSWSD